MKVTVSQQQLSHGLSIVSRAVSPRSTLPVLANVLVATDEGRLRLSATNLELGITCKIGAQVTEEGSITVPARTFGDLVSALPDEHVVLTLNERTKTLNVTCGSSSTEIKGIDAEEFPPMPVADPQAGVELNVSDFKEMIQQVVFAASNDEARPALQGVYLNMQGNELTLAATDGFRISVRKAALSSAVEKPATILIPARALSELARIASDGEKTITMITPQGRGQVLFYLENAELVSQLIDGNFPDYRAIIPRSSKTTTVINTSSFLKACKQAEIIAREGTNVVRLNILPGGDEPGKVEISAQSEETGSSEVVLDAAVEGDPLVIAFNVRFLREFLDVARASSVAVETNANTTPALLRPVGDENYSHVLMPMHLG